MTIKECIDIVDELKPNQYSTHIKVMWLSFIDETIINDVLKTHEGYDGRYDDFTGYSEDKLSVPLVVASPYDRLYTAYLKMKIDAENGETARYNNSAGLFNSYMMEYKKFYNKTHMPLSEIESRMPMPANKNTTGISGTELENIKRKIYAKLSEDLLKLTSKDKLYGIVSEYVSNNREMLNDNRNLESAIKKALEQINRIVTVTLYAAKWEGSGNLYSQEVSVPGATKSSKIDLSLSVEQATIFYQKDISFVPVNNNGVITIYCIGQKPTNDYTLQAKITEVAINE